MEKEVYGQIKAKKQKIEENKQKGKRKDRGKCKGKREKDSLQERGEYEEK